MQMEVESKQSSLGKRRFYASGKKKFKRKKNVATVKFFGPVRDNQKFNFKYAELFSINPGAVGVLGTQIFSANGLYDPDITGTGHQPMGFDQIIPFYDHYVVIASKITVWFSPRNTNTYDQLCMITLMDSNTADTDPQTALERPVCVHAMVEGTNGGNPLKLELGANPLRFLGKSGIDDNEIRGTVSTNPTEQCYFHVQSAPVQTIDAGQLDCYAVIEYTAVFVEPKALTGS